MAALKFYDDNVRDALAELADSEFQARLWMGLEPGLVSSPTECVLAIFEDSGLSRALQSGGAYGEPTDELLRRIESLTAELDLNRSFEELERDERFTESRRLAAEVLVTLGGRPLGTVRGEPLDPL